MSEKNKGGGRCAPADMTSMHESPRCGARTRSGAPCRAPAVKGKARCRMHGGATGSGAPMGNMNALKHGRYMGEIIELERKFAQLRREIRKSFPRRNGKLS